MKNFLPFSRHLVLLMCEAQCFGAEMRACILNDVLPLLGWLVCVRVCVGGAGYWEGRELIGDMSVRRS